MTSEFVQEEIVRFCNKVASDRFPSSGHSNLLFSVELFDARVIAQVVNYGRTTEPVLPLDLAHIGYRCQRSPVGHVYRNPATVSGELIRRAGIVPTHGHRSASQVLEVGDPSFAGR